MKKLFCITILILSCLGLMSQVPGWAWARQAGGPGMDTGNSIAVDQQGNQYVTGEFGRYALTAGFGNITLTSFGFSDVFVAKLDPEGNWLWAVQAGGADYEVGTAIALDPEGYVCVFGWFNETAAFGTINLTSNGWRDVFVAKLDPQGNWLWAVSGGGTGQDYSRDLAVDAAGNIYITGDFGTQGGTTTFGNTTLTSAGYSDAFVAQLDSGGNWLWAVRAGGGGSDYGYGITVTSDNRICLCGEFNGIAAFGSISLACSGYSDIFAAQLSSQGTWLWAVRAGGAGYELAGDIVADTAADVYICGIFRAAATFGTTVLTPDHARNIFVAKLDSQGNWLWATGGGGSDDYGDWYPDLEMDAWGNVCVAGYFMDTSLFGPYSLTSSGGRDVFAAKLDPFGNWLWAQSAGGSGHDLTLGIAAYSVAELYLTGFINQTANFGTTVLTSYGSEDIYVALLSFGSQFDHDLAALSVSGNVNPDPGIETDYTVTVYNNGTAAQSAYTVKLMRMGSIELASIPGQPIPPQDTLSFSLTWSPDAAGTACLYGKVVLAGDQFPDNNHSTPLPVVVQNTGTILATVTAPQYQPIQGALVTCGSVCETTDDSGSALLQVEAGTHDVTASHPDYLPMTQSGVQVIQGQIVLLDFDLEPTGNVDPIIPDTDMSVLQSIAPNPVLRGKPARIHVGIAKGERGLLSVHNLKGQLLQTSELAPGEHLVSFDSRGLPSGLYLVRVQTQKTTMVKKVVVFK